MTAPLVTWRTKTSNPPSWNWATLEMTIPMTMVPIKNWSFFYNYSNVSSVLKYKMKKYLTTWTQLWCKQGKPLRCPLEISSGTDLYKQSYSPLVLHVTTAPLVTWRTKTSNPPSWNWATLEMTIPMTMVPIKNWSFFYNYSNVSSVLKYKMKKYLTTWTQLWCKQGKPLRCPLEISSGTDLYKQSYSPLVLPTFPLTPRHVLPHSKSLL